MHHLATILATALFLGGCGGTTVVTLKPGSPSADLARRAGMLREGELQVAGTVRARGTSLLVERQEEELLVRREDVTDADLPGHGAMAGGAVMSLLGAGVAGVGIVGLTSDASFIDVRPLGGVALAMGAGLLGGGIALLSAGVRWHSDAKSAVEGDADDVAVTAGPDGVALTVEF